MDVYYQKNKTHRSILISSFPCQGILKKGDICLEYVVYIDRDNLQVFYVFMIIELFSIGIYF